MTTQNATEEAKARLDQAWESRYASEEMPARIGFHAITMGIAYFSAGVLGALGIFGNLWDSFFLSDLMGDSDRMFRTSALARLFSLPCAALGLFCFMNASNVEFVKTTVTGRLLFIGIGIPVQYFLFDDTPDGILVIWLLDVVPALLAFYDMWRQGLYSVKQDDEDEDEAWAEEEAAKEPLLPTIDPETQKNDEPDLGAASGYASLP